jgi:hypothetical protein
MVFMFTSLFLNPLWKNSHLAISSEGRLVWIGPSQNIFALIQSVLEVRWLTFVSLGAWEGGTLAQKECEVEPTQIVSRFSNFFHKNLNYLGGESTNSGPLGIHGTMA